MMNKNEEKTIVVLEDEKGIRRGLKLNLEAEGFRVQAYESAESALIAAQEWSHISLGIFDIMLPGDVDGIEFCRKIREQGYGFPVIFLSARDRLEDKLKGFDSGGDDYLTKPFELEELLARVKVRLKNPLLSVASDATLVRIGEYQLDFKGASARSVRNHTVHRFNLREMAILKLLVANRGRAVTRDEILDEVWGTAEFPTNRTIDNYMVKFRKIFEPNPQQPRYIITRHGSGYELAVEE